MRKEFHIISCDNFHARFSNKDLESFTGINLPTLEGTIPSVFQYMYLFPSGFLSSAFTLSFPNALPFIPIPYHTTDES